MRAFVVVAITGAVGLCVQIHSEFAQWLDPAIVPRMGFWLIIAAAFALFFRRQLIPREGTAWCSYAVAVAAVSIAIGWIPIGLPAWLAFELWVLSILVLTAALGRGWLLALVPAICLLTLLPVPDSELYELIIRQQQVLTATTLRLFSRWVLDIELMQYGMALYAGASGSPASASPVFIAIAEECGGFRSLHGLMLLATTAAASVRLLPVRKLQLLLVAVSLAVGLNLLRVCMLMVFWRVGALMLLDEPWHGLLSHLLLVAGAYGVVSVYWRLRTTTSATAQAERSYLPC